MSSTLSQISTRFNQIHPTGIADTARVEVTRNKQKTIFHMRLETSCVGILHLNHATT